MPNGKICYVEIPAQDIEVSARFYEQTFGWTSRLRGDGERAFDDTTGAVSGSWVLGRPAHREQSMMIYIMVDSIDDSVKKIVSAGGQLVTPSTALGTPGEAFATITDPAGNLIGLYQQPPK